VKEGNANSRGKCTAQQPTLLAPGPAHLFKKEESMDSSQRHRGAQPGNTNALKHGFYSPRFSPLELHDLDSALVDGLDDEIALLRVAIRRVFDLASDEGENSETWFRTLSTLGLASARLAGLLRTQKIIQGDTSSVASALSQALGEVCDELGIY